ncbi:sugar phosphate isomerase/epimerase family protein [Streptomyces sp. NPDC007901]|uniref:sugar phosphate isomerase/epimerase family protein n=1 Tax=Streptomyces sp. NPDC007901 TaxID=3364785 RepID=UPI0036EE550A
MVAELGYGWIELSPREDFIPFFRHPRVDDATVAKFRKALDAAGVGISSILPLFRWSGPDEDARQAAVRYWKRSIQIAADLGVTSMISEFNGRPEEADRSEAQFWRSMDELLPLFEREGIKLALEPHPDDFVEKGYDAVSLIRGINHPGVGFLYCAGDLLTHVHLADAFDHTASSGNRYILNPPGTAARIHQHLDMGEGEVDFDELFRALRANGFDGTLTACVFAWEEKAEESSRFMREKIGEYLAV